MNMKNVVAVSKEGVTIKDSAAMRTMMDGLIYDAVFSEGDKKNAFLILIKEFLVIINCNMNIQTE